MSYSTVVAVILLVLGCLLFFSCSGVHLRRIVARIELYQTNQCKIETKIRAQKPYELFYLSRRSERESLEELEIASKHTRVSIENLSDTVIDYRLKPGGSEIWSVIGPGEKKLVYSGEFWKFKVKTGHGGTTPAKVIFFFDFDERVTSKDELQMNAVFSGP